MTILVVGQNALHDSTIRPNSEGVYCQCAQLYRKRRIGGSNVITSINGCWRQGDMCSGCAVSSTKRSRIPVQNSASRLSTINHPYKKTTRTAAHFLQRGGAKEPKGDARNKDFVSRSCSGPAICHRTFVMAECQHGV